MIFPVNVCANETLTISLKSRDFNGTFFFSNYTVISLAVGKIEK